MKLTGYLQKQCLLLNVVLSLNTVRYTMNFHILISRIASVMIPHRSTSFLPEKQASPMCLTSDTSNCDHDQHSLELLSHLQIFIFALVIIFTILFTLQYFIFFVPLAQQYKCNIILWGYYLLLYLSCDIKSLRKNKG